MVKNMLVRIMFKTMIYVQLKLGVNTLEANRSYLL